MHEHMQDGTVLYYREKQGDGPVVLLLPDVGETIRDPFWMRLQHRLGHSVAVDLRGHGQSLGTYSYEGHWRDILHWIAKLRGQLYVIAKGLSASLLLHYENEAHFLHKRPPLPDGMVLLDPWFEGRKTSQEPNLKKYVLDPVRVQTPTRIFIPAEEYTTEHLRRLFGTCMTFSTKLLHGKQSKAEQSVLIKDIVGALTAVQEHERPIRFRASR